MDVSPVSGRCSSDFSIERILSEDSRRREDDDVPNWLCCTRYKPPRLPRSTNACRTRRSGRHARVPFTADQAAALEAAYARAPYLAPPALRALAAALQLRDDRIKIWFQNRRARERREKSANITPPREVTLPPTQRILASSGLWLTQNVYSLPTHLPDSATYEDIREDREAPCDLTMIPSRSTLYAQTAGATPDDEQSETPLDIESVDE